MAVNVNQNNEVRAGLLRRVEGGSFSIEWFRDAHSPASRAAVRPRDQRSVRWGTIECPRHHWQTLGDYSLLIPGRWESGPVSECNRPIFRAVSQAESSLPLEASKASTRSNKGGKVKGA